MTDRPLILMPSPMGSDNDDEDESGEILHVHKESNADAAAAAAAANSQGSRSPHFSQDRPTLAIPLAKGTPTPPIVVTWGAPGLSPPAHPHPHPPLLHPRSSGSSLLSVSPRISSRNFKNASAASSTVSVASTSPSTSPAGRTTVLEAYSRAAPTTPPPRPRPRQSHRHRHSGKGKGRAPSSSMRPRAPAADDSSVDTDDEESYLHAYSDARAANPRHSHGLSWSSETRDDVVDNLLFSLDNFSRADAAPLPPANPAAAPAPILHTQPPSSIASRDWYQEPEKDPYLHSLTTRSVPAMEYITTRARRGTHSSTASSDQESPMQASKYSPASPGRRSNSSNNYPPRSNLRFKSLIAHGRNSSEAQRPPLDDLMYTQGQRIGSDASSSSIHAFGSGLDNNVGRLGWSNGRSFSMDNMSHSNGTVAATELSPPPRSATFAGQEQRGANPRLGPSAFASNHHLHQPHDSLDDDDLDDAAPEPIVAAGPRKMQNPSSHGPLYVNPSLMRSKGSVLRKTSNQPPLQQQQTPAPSQGQRSSSANTPSTGPAASIRPQTDGRSTALSHNSAAAIPDDVRTQAADFVSRNSSIRGTLNVPPPPLSPGEAAPSPDVVRRRDSSPPRERQGFFKRVFGGGASRNTPLPASVGPDRPVSKQIASADPVDSHASNLASPLVSPFTASSPPARARAQTSAADANHTPTTAAHPLPSASTTTVNARSDERQTSMTTSGATSPPPMPPPPPALSKKGSSFFRRRKKSTSGTLHPVPPPLPLGSNSSYANLSIKPAEPSPSISSLRKAMGAYLGGDEATTTDTTTTNNAAPATLSPLPPSITAVKNAFSSPRDPSRPLTSASHDSDDLFHPGYVLPFDSALGGPLRPLSEVSSQPSSTTDSKRKQETYSGMGTIAISKLGDPLHGDFAGPGLRYNAQDVTTVKNASLLSTPRLDKDGEDFGSRPSTGEKIIATQTAKDVNGPSPPAAGMREFIASNNVGLSMSPNDGWNGKPAAAASYGERANKFDRAEGDAWVIKRHQEAERPSSRRSERLILQPSPGDEEVDLSRGPRDVSPLDENVPRATLVSPATAASPSPTPGTLPLPSLNVDRDLSRSSSLNDLRDIAAFVDEGVEYRERAKKIFDGNEDDVPRADAAAWMGEKNTLSMRTLQAYMNLFDFTGMNILSALRTLCGKLQLRGETQQFDRIITALSARWCACNVRHGFKAQDVVHTIFYSIILLNTDLHLADIPEKMSRNAYVKNTLPTIRRVVMDVAPNAFDETLKPGSAQQSRPSVPWMDFGFSSPTSPSFPIPEITGGDEPPEPPRAATMNSATMKRLSAIRPGLPRNDSEAGASEDGSSNILVSTPWTGSLRAWEGEIEVVLKSFYSAIGNRPLPLQGAMTTEPLPSERNLSVVNLGGNGRISRTPSIISRAPSDNMSYRAKGSFGPRWVNSRSNRSRQKLYPASTIGSSRTSLEDSGSLWSPTQSSKYSYSKTLTSASVNSFGAYSDVFKHSIGFANALSQAIIREEGTAGGDSDSVSVAGAATLDDDTLALEGAPWAKEGLVKHKHHLETTDRKAKERSWVDCFAVISKGKLTLFAFNTTTKSQSHSRRTGFGRLTGGNKAASVTGARVGGGDWMENAEQLEVFVLRQTIASTLPPPGYSKTRPHVWALSLPNGAVHLFQVGTPEIATEFMTTANYWSARTSKEPLSGGVSNIEYGWSDRVINSAAAAAAAADRAKSPSGSISTPPSSLATRGGMGHMHSMSTERAPRASMQSSVRGSFDTGFGSKAARLPGDKASIVEWQPPSQSMMPSQLMEVDQLRQLTAYVAASEDELEKHNELKHAIALAYTPRHPNFARTMANWQRKSDYLLREIVKFRTYIDSLHAAQTAKEAYYARKNEAAARAISPSTRQDSIASAASPTSLLSPASAAAPGEPKSMSAQMMSGVQPRGIHTSG